MFLNEPQYVVCPRCSHSFYWPCDPNEFRQDKNQLKFHMPPVVTPAYCTVCGDYEVHFDGKCHTCALREAHPEVSDFVGDDDHAPPDVDRGGFRQ